MTSIIVFGGTKGGVGKTGLARATMVEAARKGINVIGVDLNPKQCTLARWAELREARGTDPALSVFVARHASHAIEICRNSGADLAVIDAPGEANVGTLKIAQAADLFVQVAGRSLDDLEPLVNLAHELTEQGIDRRKLVAVSYKVDRNLDCARRDHEQITAYVQAAGQRVLGSFVRDLRGYRNNHNTGLAISEASHVGPRVEAQRAVSELIELLVARSS